LCDTVPVLDIGLIPLKIIQAEIESVAEQPLETI